jgi:hypothetical protein
VPTDREESDELVKKTFDKMSVVNYEMLEEDVKERSSARDGNNN